MSFGCPRPEEEEELDHLAAGQLPVSPWPAAPEMRKLASLKLWRRLRPGDSFSVEVVIEMGDQEGVKNDRRRGRMNANLLEQARLQLLQAADEVAGASRLLADVYVSAAEGLEEIGRYLATGELPEGREIDVAGELFAACQVLDDVDPSLAYAIREEFAPMLAAFARDVTEIAAALREALEGE